VPDQTADWKLVGCSDALDRWLAIEATRTVRCDSIATLSLPF
jgi:hypothetical protein